MHRPDCTPTISEAELGGAEGDVVGPGEDGVGPGFALFSASSVELYAAFLLPLHSNSSGVPLERHESQSRTPHTVMPLHRATARQSLTTLRYVLACVVPEPSMSNSVICTSTPSAAKLDNVVR